MYALAVKPPAVTPPVCPFPARPLTVQSLALSHEGEVLAFLARRPLHTVIMAGSIRNNGLVNEKDQVAQACYHKAGYKQRGNYDTVSSQQQ